MAKRVANSLGCISISRSLSSTHGTVRPLKWVARCSFCGARMTKPKSPGCATAVSAGNHSGCHWPSLRMPMTCTQFSRSKLKMPSSPQACGGKEKQSNSGWNGTRFAVTSDASSAVVDAGAWFRMLRTPETVRWKPGTGGCASEAMVSSRPILLTTVSISLLCDKPRKIQSPTSNRTELRGKLKVPLFFLTSCKCAKMVGPTSLRLLPRSPLSQVSTFAA
mmetsp:Transcript_28252/g.65976  ORF Transcript_28252/g.65976 Transcript_28252/m.65976 type:complete len:220 (-) Transcript_28252:842-1501(-)